MESSFSTLRQRNSAIPQLQRNMVIIHYSVTSSFEKWGKNTQFINFC